MFVNFVVFDSFYFQYNQHANSLKFAVRKSQFLAYTLSIEHQSLTTLV